MSKYLVIYEQAGDNYSAYAPDLPGCIACGETLEETEGLMREAIGLYLHALEEEGQDRPVALTQAHMIDVA